MIRIFGKIPITIYPTFWLFAALVGYVNSLNFFGTLVWVGIIFISILFHEFGHALTAVTFRQNARIELVAFGGLTYHEGEKLPFWKQFLIVFDGPLFGFLLFLIATLIIQLVPLENKDIQAALSTFQWVNLFWTVLNLLPVMPLDGGQLLRIILEAIFGVRGFKYALMTSMLIATGMSLFFFLYQAFLIGALFFLLAFQSYDAWRRTRFLSEQDRSDSLKKKLEEAEFDLHVGKKNEAMIVFEKIRNEARKGMIYILATQYLAFLKYELGKTRETYDLLFPIRTEISSDALCLLHRAAFDEKDFPLVIEIGGQCFQLWPNVETALRNAYACALLSQAVPAVGWLHTAMQEGLQNIEEIINESGFDKIRHDPPFEEFLGSLRK
jgi:stage IV sporulation protein FB